MTRASLALWTVGGFALLLAGCANTDVSGLLALKSVGQPGDRVVTGNIRAVADTTQKSLGKLGLSATVTPAGDAIWVSSQTPTGAKFKMVLTSEKTPQGVERTHIRVQWDSQRDDRTGASVLADIEAQHKS